MKILVKLDAPVRYTTSSGIVASTDVIKVHATFRNHGIDVTTEPELFEEKDGNRRRAALSFKPKDMTVEEKAAYRDFVNRLREFIKRGLEEKLGSNSVKTFDEINDPDILNPNIEL